ncbi:MAG: ribosome small subunit-dependent GTPase A [Clostridiales bacterium]
MTKTKGLLIKGYNGFYYVKAENKLWSCSLRGRFRLTKQKFLPGDVVMFTEIEFPKGVIEEVLPRKNQLVRPSIANVEQAVITFALTAPNPDFLLLDRILVQVLEKEITPIICFNKADLVSEEERIKLISPYEKSGFTVICVSAETGSGIEALKKQIEGHLVVLAGPSGVGKSSILNALNSEFHLETGELSKKVERGKHTTRKVELLPLDEITYIADTPGFSTLFLPDGIEKNTLVHYYPEIFEAAHNCPFKSCMHHKERDCAVKDGVEKGLIDKGRYERYCILFEELKEREGKY